MEQETHTITCPFCWQLFDILVDPSAYDQSYTEDCQICCHPILITIKSDGEQVSDVAVERE